MARTIRSSTGRTPVQSVIRTYEAFEGDGLKLTIETVAVDGTKGIGGYSAHFDGKPYASASSVEDIDTVVLKRIDGRTHELAVMKGSTVLAGHTTTVSPDGKTLTVTTPNGFLAVFDKQ